MILNCHNNKSHHIKFIESHEKVVGYVSNSIRNRVLSREMMSEAYKMDQEQESANRSEISIYNTGDYSNRIENTRVNNQSDRVHESQFSNEKSKSINIGQKPKNYSNKINVLLQSEIIG